MGEELEAIVEVGGLFDLTMHPFISGRPARAAALEQLIERAQIDGWRMGAVGRRDRGLGGGAGTAWGGAPAAGDVRGLLPNSRRCVGLSSPATVTR